MLRIALILILLSPAFAYAQKHIGLASCNAIGGVCLSQCGGDETTVNEILIVAGEYKGDVLGVRCGGLNCCVTKNLNVGRCCVSQCAAPTDGQCADGSKPDPRPCSQIPACSSTKSGK